LACPLTPLLLEHASSRVRRTANPSVCSLMLETLAANHLDRKPPANLGAGASPANERVAISFAAGAPQPCTFALQCSGVLGCGLKA